MLTLVLAAFEAHAGICDIEAPTTTCHGVCASFPGDEYTCGFFSAAFSAPSHDASITAALNGSELYFYGVDSLGSDFCCDADDFPTDWNGSTDGCSISVSQSPTYTTSVDLSQHPAVDGCTVYGNAEGQGVTIIGTEQADDVYCLDGDNTILGLDGADLIYAGEGDDDVFGGPGDDVIYTGAPRFDSTTSTVSYDGIDAGTNYVNGEQGMDRIIGGDGVDEIQGGPGRDTIDAEGGPDVVCGGPGDDLLNGGSGTDYLWGGAGVDQHRGGPGTDRCEDQFKTSCGGADTTSCPIVAP
jgi:Ca2+-binding RTX toxin-like protein